MIDQRLAFSLPNQD